MASYRQTYDGSKGDVTTHRSSKTKCTKVDRIISDNEGEKDPVTFLKQKAHAMEEAKSVSEGTERKTPGQRNRVTSSLIKGWCDIRKRTGTHGT